MTVKEVVSVMPEVEKITLSWQNCPIEFDQHNELVMEAYGDYEVGRIYPYELDGNNCAEIHIKAVPQRRTA